MSYLMLQISLKYAYFSCILVLIIKKLGGSVEITSELGKGTNVYLTILKKVKLYRTFMHLE